VIVIDALGKYPAVGAVASSLRRPAHGPHSIAAPTQQVWAGSRLAGRRGCAILHADTVRVIVTSSLIIGSGPAAAGVALALSRHRDEEITVIDSGTRLSAAKRSVVDRLASLPSSEWSAEEIASIRAESVERARRSLPEKLSYGSDYAFRDVGELRAYAPSGPPTIPSSRELMAALTQCGAHRSCRSQRSLRPFSL
jgi:hypothetical protein